MGEAAKKISGFEQNLIDSVPPPADYKNVADREAVALLKRLKPEQQVKVLRKLGVSEANPFTVSEGVRNELLSAIAEVAFNVETPAKGRSRIEISTPFGGKKRK